MIEEEILEQSKLLDEMEGDLISRGYSGVVAFYDGRVLDSGEDEVDVISRIAKTEYATMPVVIRRLGEKPVVMGGGPR